MMDFGKHVAEVWHTGVLGVSLGQVVTAILVLLVFLGLRRVFYRFVVSSLRAVTRKTKSELDDLVLHAVEKPLEFGFVVVGVLPGRSDPSHVRGRQCDVRQIHSIPDRTVVVLGGVSLNRSPFGAHGPGDRHAGQFEHARYHEGLFRQARQIRRDLPGDRGGVSGVGIQRSRRYWGAWDSWAWPWPWARVSSSRICSRD